MQKQVYTLYSYYTLHTFILLSRTGPVFTLLGRRFFQNAFIYEASLLEVFLFPLSIGIPCPKCLVETIFALS